MPGASSHLLVDPIQGTYYPVNLQFFCNQVIDDDDPAEIYIGYSVQKVAQDAVGWRILRVKRDATTTFLERLWAGGDSAFNKKFSLRTTYTY